MTNQNDDVDGAGLIGPAIPDVAGTEPRPSLTKPEAWAAVLTAVQAGDPEDTLQALGVYFAAEAAVETHPLVVGILRDLSDTMSQAALDYYVSTK